MSINKDEVELGVGPSIDFIKEVSSVNQEG